MPRFLRLLILITSIILCPLGFANDLIVSRAFFEDTTANLRIDEVVNQEFTPIGQTLHKGYTQSAFWLRLKVQTPNPGNQIVFLIRQPYLDEIRLFEATDREPSTWPIRISGNFSDKEKREHLGASPVFRANPSAQESTYYVRLKTNSLAQLTIEALTAPEAVARTHNYDLLQLFFCTSMLALLLWAVHSYVTDKQAVIGWFILHQAAYLVYGMTVTGYLGLLFPELPNLYASEFVTLTYCASNFTTLLFCRALFRPYNPAPLLLRGIDLLLLVFPFQIAAVLVGYPILAAASNFVLVRATWWYLTITTFTFRTERSPSRGKLQILFLITTTLFTVLWVSYSNATGNVDNPYFGRGVLITNGLIIGFLFASLLSGHTRRIKLEAQRAQMELVLAQRTLQIERAENAKIEVLARTDHLTGISNRRHLFEQSEGEIERALRYARPLAVLVIDIDHFKPVNDTLGHSAGDEVLLKVTLLIRDSLRSTDLFGRTGGEEFAAILVETDTESARVIAERVRSAVAAADIITSANHRVKVTLSIGLSELKNRQIDISELINEADRALYVAKQTGRNKVVYQTA